MKYMFLKIRTKEVEMIDENNCINHLIKGFTVEPIESVVADDDAEAIEAVMKNHHDLLESYEADDDYLEWFKKNMSDDGKTIFATLYKLAQEGETVDWRYNG